MRGAASAVGLLRPNATITPNRTFAVCAAGLGLLSLSAKTSIYGVSTAAKLKTDHTRSRAPRRQRRRFERALSTIRGLMDTELAVVKAEVIARLGENYHANNPRNIDSHVTGRALAELQRRGIVQMSTQIGKGGRRIDTYEPAEQRGRRTAIAAAARRKRALYARYLSWADTSVRYSNGFLGPAGEAATRSAIIESGAMQPATPNAGPVSRLLDHTFTGPLDSGGYMTAIRNGTPQPAVVVLVEVKNIRDWIYPSNQELFQVLRKGVELQRHRPAVPILPVLVCRRAQKTTFYMAQQLGFFVIDMGAQFVGKHVTEQSLLDVRNELAFGDLRLGNGPSLRVRDRFRQTLPGVANQFALTWAGTALDPEISQLITRCALRRTSTADRFQLVEQIRSLNEQKGYPGGW